MRVNGCNCTDPSVHKLDGLPLSSFTDEKTAEAVMTAYIKTLQTHPSFDEQPGGNYVYMIMLNEKDKVDTMKIEIRPVEKTAIDIQQFVNWSHPHAQDGKHTIVLILMRYGPGGAKFSKANGFLTAKL